MTTTSVSRPRSSGRAFVLLVYVALTVLFAWLAPWKQSLDGEGGSLRAWLAAEGDWAPVFFVGLNAAGVVLSLPRLAFAFLAGAVFGWQLGAPLAVLGTLLGSLVTFTWARWLGRPWVEARLAGRLGGLREACRDHGLLVNVVVRLAPVGSCHLTNLAFAVSPMPPGAFVLGTILGVLPDTIVYALIGSAAGGDSIDRLSWGLGLLALLGLLWFLLSRRSTLARRVLSSLGSKDR